MIFCHDELFNNTAKIRFFVKTNESGVIENGVIQLLNYSVTQLLNYWFPINRTKQARNYGGCFKSTQMTQIVMIYADMQFAYF